MLYSGPQGFYRKALWEPLGGVNATGLPWEKAATLDDDSGSILPDWAAGGMKRGAVIRWSPRWHRAPAFVTLEPTRHRSRTSERVGRNFIV